MSDWASGAFALGGAFIGGLGSFVATAFEARSRRGEAQSARQERLTDERRLLYSTLIERADALADTARSVYGHAQPSDVSGELRERYLSMWDLAVRARSHIAIIGPASVADAATTLFQTLIDICNPIDDWLAGAAWSDEDEKARNANVDKRAKAKAEFVAIATEVLNTQT